MLVGIYKKLVDGISVKGKDPASGKLVDLSMVQDANGDWVLRTVNAAPHGFDSKLNALNVQSYDTSLLKSHDAVAWVSGQNTVYVGDNIGILSASVPIDVSKYKNKMIYIKNNYTLGGTPKEIRYRVNGYLSLTKGQTLRVPITEYLPLPASGEVWVEHITTPKLTLPVMGMSVDFTVSQFSSDRPDGGTAIVKVIGGKI